MTKTLSERTKRVLLVDDEPHVSRVLTLSLERAGYSVACAPNGAVALAHIDAEPPDALITDVHMPTMTGQQLCEHITSADDDPGFPIFVLTGHAEEETRSWVDGVRNARIFEKPVSVRALLAELKSVLGGELHV